MFPAQIVCPSLAQRYNKIAIVAREIENEIKAATTGRSVTENTQKTAEARCVPVPTPHGLWSATLLLPALVGISLCLQRPGNATPHDHVFEQVLNRWQQKFTTIHRKSMNSLYLATCKQREAAQEAAGLPSRNSRKRKGAADEGTTLTPGWLLTCGPDSRKDHP